MTISEYARKHGVTPQAVYKRLSTKGIKVSTLCNKDKTLTEKGIAALDELMQLKDAVNQVDNHRSTVVNRVEQLLLLHKGHSPGIHDTDRGQARERQKPPSQRVECAAG